MTASSSPNAGRPLSPHLSIWRWGPAMAVSIIHRISGNGLAFVGLPILAWFLAALAGGEEAWVPFARHAGSWYGLVVLIGLSWSFFQHLASGLRHFVLDIGAGYEIETNNRWSWVVLATGAVLTALFWAFVLLR
ncbi:MAG TPA: succinate dehydrogenase, cytochrome b556 subunit [Novosphingobium sp.]|nr:succinate dehydrogenase, cytochrome b556 subunit [Novosphingobium sp.]